MVLPKKKLKFFTSGKGINICFKKIKPILTMPILKNLRTVGYPLLVLTKQGINFYKKIRNYCLEFLKIIIGLILFF
jgi:hypothetical protein